MKRVENSVTKGEIAHHEQFNLLSHCFQKSSAAYASNCYAVFFNGSEIFEQSWQRVHQGTFVQNNFQIGPVLLDKKIFKVLTMHI